MAKDFLLEIGVEELPARFLDPTLEQLRNNTAQALQDNRLVYKEIIPCGTPRRITVFVRDVEEMQQPLLQEVKGPAVKVAFDATGAPSRAAIGFAKSNGVAVEDLTTKSVGPVDYVFALKKAQGRPGDEVLAEIAPTLISGLRFPKPMRWGDLSMRFARPIRWLLCLFGDAVLPFEMAGLHTDRYTYGHRFFSGQKLIVNEAGKYWQIMANAQVIVDINKRREIIRRQIIDTASAVGGEAEIDADLLSEVVNIVEYPTSFCGSFDPAYLHLPEEALITPMREHQRYFPVLGSQGRLMPKFIAVSNSGGDQESIDIIRAGNEKVLKARLADAAFFWQEDLKVNLADRVEGLKKVVFQESLGTVYEKVRRLITLSEKIAVKLGVSEADRTNLARTAYLAKADLLTNMVYEFPELQGIMGREYASRQGESEEVAKAIYEHYLPRFAGDELPFGLLGQILSIADKIDNLTGCYSLGIIPTGSQDPYALRRQALGVCHIILSGNLLLSLKELVNEAYQGYAGQAALQLSQEQVRDELEEFIKQRLRGLFIEQGLTYDTIDAVLAAGIDDIAGVGLRIRALESFRGSADFEALLIAFTRANNLAKKAVVDTVDVSLLAEPAEEALYKAYTEVFESVEAWYVKRDYLQALPLIAMLRQPIDRFFNDVMVMVDDAGVRNNRLALLKKISTLTYGLADLSKIVAPN